MEKDINQIPLDDLIMWEEDENKEVVETPTVPSAQTPQTPNEDETTTEEPTEEVTEETVEETPTENTEETAEVTGELGTYYKFLESAGLLSVDKDFKFDGSQDKLIEAIEASKTNLQNQAIMTIWNNLPDAFKPFLEYGLSGGTDVEKIKSIVTNNAELDNFDLENLDHQEELVKRHLKKTTKYGDARINSLIKVFKDSNVLEQEAEAALKELKDLHEVEKKQLIEEQKKQEALEIEEIKKARTVLTDTVKKMEVTDKRKTQIIDAVFNEGKYGNKVQSYFDYVDEVIKQNPEHFAQLVNIYMEYDPRKGFNALKNAKTIETQSKKNLRDYLTQLGTGQGTPKGGVSPDKKTNFDLEMFNKLTNN